MSNTAHLLSAFLISFTFLSLSVFVLNTALINGFLSQMQQLSQRHMRIFPPLLHEQNDNDQSAARNTPYDRIKLKMSESNYED